jgi:ribonuclease R
MRSDAEILSHIARQPRRRAGYKQLVRELCIQGRERREFEQQLTALVRKGSLVERDGSYAMPGEGRGNLVTGTLSLHRDGYGFVTPSERSLRERIAGDIFIPPPAVGAAMHGDRVLVEVGRIRADGRAEGRIVKVVERTHETVVGVFHYGPRHNYVTPSDQKVARQIVIPPGREYPEEAARDDQKAAPRPPAGKKPRLTPHRVLGEEAQRRSQREDLEGMVVDVAITDFPTATREPRGRVVEILGAEDDFGVDVEIVIRKYHIPHRFPAPVLAEAERWEDMVPARELRLRRDYRSLPIVTIDGETARDFDDAVFVRRLHGGNFELQVHIADVAHYVRPGSALDAEARLRGTSVYFPDRAVPMLPLELSTNICSLRPHTDRLVMSCTMEIDREGEVVAYEVNPGVIRSAERMTYTNVNLALEGDPAQRERYAPLVDIFELMKHVAVLLNRKRARRGSIDFDLPEPVIEFDDFGLMKSIVPSERNWAHRLIEEFMLAANESVAGYLEGRHIASLYRVHEKPDPRRVADFETIAATFGYSLGVGALPIKRVQMKADRRERYGTGRRAPTIELPEEVHITPRMYQKLTQQISGTPEERILSYLMLRSLKQARYAEENLGHFALAAPTYTHFTSPIRRYPDLIVHRLLKDALQEPEERDGEVPVGTGRPPSSESPSPWTKRVGQATSPVRAERRKTNDERRPSISGPIPLDELHAIAESSSETERRADDAERELMEWKKVKFMADRIGDEFDGLIVSVTKFGFFVELVDLFVEGLVPIDTLTGDHYIFHENTRELIGQRSRRKFKIGERARVLVDRIDWVEKKIQFALVEPEPSPREKRRRR